MSLEKTTPNSYKIFIYPSAIKKLDKKELNMTPETQENEGFEDLFEFEDELDNEDL